MSFDLAEILARIEGKLDRVIDQQVPSVRRGLREDREAERASATIDCTDLAQMLGARGDGATSLAELGRRRALRDQEIMALRLTGGDGKSHYRWRRKDVAELLAGRRQERAKNTGRR